jgi:hypothetical protein
MPTMSATAPRNDFIFGEGKTTDAGEVKLGGLKTRRVRWTPTV